MNNHDYSGSLEFVDLLEILSSIYDERRTGHLLIEKGREVKSIYFHNGEIVFASSNQKEDRLAQVLYKAGLLARRQMEDVLTAIRKTGRRQGTVLIERGLLKQDGLANAISLQIKQILYSVLLWERGSFAFQAGERPRQSVPVAIDTAALVREIIERFKESGAPRR